MWVPWQVNTSKYNVWLVLAFCQRLGSISSSPVIWAATFLLEVHLKIQGALEKKMINTVSTISSLISDDVAEMITSLQMKQLLM